MDGLEYYLDGYLKNNLDLLVKDVRDDNDCVFVVSGREGSGKSTVTFQAAKYVDPTFTLDRVVFNTEDFHKIIISLGKKREKYKAVVFDEAIAGARAAQWATHVSQAIIQLLAQIRQFNLFVFIVIPSFFELNRYIAVHRSQALIHCYRDKLGRRGSFAGYGWEKKKRLFLVGRKEYNMRVQHPDFIGSFTKFMPLDDAKYREKKIQALSKAQEPPQISPLMRKGNIQRDGLIRYLKDQLGTKQADIARIITAQTPEMPMTPRGVSVIIAKTRLTPPKP